jgi:uncharacterized pyridoxamine 5'-phosphate oxidase family protein
MRAEDNRQGDPSMESVAQFLTANSPFFFATVDEEGRPRVRPFGFVAVHNNRLYFSMGSYKPVYRQVRANPHVEISAVDSENRWLRLRGTAVVDEDPAVAAMVFEQFPRLRDLYNDKTGLTLALVYLKDASADFCDMSGNTRTVAF